MTELAQLQASAEQAAALLKAMSHPKRLLILCMLSGSPGTSAGELTRITGLSASATSQHLARMRDEGLINSQRDAQRILYSIKNEAVNAIIATLKNVLKQIWLHYPCWNSQVFRLNYVASKLYSTARQVNAPVITPIN